MERAAVIAGHLTAVKAPEVLTSSSADGLARVKLNRPSKLNSLSLGMIRELEQAYSQLIAGKAKCVLLSGEGRAFCAGGDVAAVREESLNGGSLPFDFFYEEYALIHTIATMWHQHQIPQVAIWNGITMGGGVGLSAHGRFRVCTEKILFAKPETKIGLFPDVGSTWMLPRLSAGKAVGLYIGLTGARLKAADCLWSGLATHFIPSERLPELEQRLAALGAELTESSIQDVLDQLSAHPDQDKATLQPHAAAIERCFCFKTMGEIFRALEKEQDDQVWAGSTLKALRQMSPTSLKLTLEACLLNAEPTVSIGQALSTEYRMVQRCVLRPQPFSDFYEGIRAVLIDKKPD
eukprot:TRINITY_DN61506_c0_g1_i3.p1 TRINITY_DN61506_c0_g1~~TRINITY_DN61506_c0_g1_i3.p1  ORF type:complete len:349 (-),score=93.77 TRINITY_DN61506_c0_g1_i3:102-1148(-)